MQPTHSCNVAVVASHDSVARLLSRALTEQGFTATVMTDVTAVIGALRRRSVHAVVIEDDHVHTRHWLAALTQHADLPAAIAVVGVDAAEGMELLARGATDFVALPQARGELGARLHARMAASRTPSLALVGHALGVQLDTLRGVLRSGRRSVQLTPREAALMRTLLAQAGEIVNVATIGRSVWGAEGLCGHRTLEQQVARLRRKLADAGLSEIRIRASGGVGYRLDVAEPAAPSRFMPARSMHTGFAMAAAC